MAEGDVLHPARMGDVKVDKAAVAGISNSGIPNQKDLIRAVGHLIGVDTDKVSSKINDFIQTQLKSDPALSKNISKGVNTEVVSAPVAGAKPSEPGKKGGVA